MTDEDLFLAIKSAVEKLDQSTQDFSKELAGKCFNNSHPIIEWSNYFYSAEKTGVCDDFIDGLRASVVESIFVVP